MDKHTRKSLDEYLALKYPFNVVADPDGGYVIVFPDLPGCITQLETLDDVGPMAEEIRTLWLETAYEQGLEIPLPSSPEEYSGKFNLRLPRSLHRSLAESAEREGVSLNQYLVGLLSQRDVQARVEHRLGDLEALIEVVQERLLRQGSNVPANFSNATSHEVFRQVWDTFAERLSRQRPPFRKWFAGAGSTYESVALYSFCKSYTTFFEFNPSYDIFTQPRIVASRRAGERSEDDIVIAAKWLDRHFRSQEILPDLESALSE